MNLKKEISIINIGSNTICVAIAKEDRKEGTELIESSKIRIVGVGYQLAKGIKRGSITNLSELEESILGTIAIAEGEAQKSIKSVLVALPSWALSFGVADSSISVGQLPVDDIHISSLMNFDTSKYVDFDTEVIHMFPVSYSIDDVGNIADPIGMVGSKLSSTYHIIAAKSTVIKNITNCLNRNNIEISGFISSTYASALSVLLDEEISSGVTLIDVGGSTTSIACMYDGALLHLGCIPVGSQHITNDIATVLRTTKSNAERLKILYGATVGPSAEESVLVSRVDEYGDEHVQNISKGMLDSIISARLDEILNLVQDYIRESGADKTLYQRIVITGGGSRLSGLNEFIKSKKHFGDLSIRLGKPMGVVGSHDFVKAASFASVAGGAMYCLGNFVNKGAFEERKTLWQKVVTWIKRGI
ncbi:MAG: cell division protein FtsA [Holosporales bacterium]|jgi:cell division protein FtsA|nr:cell division protein FtsA [Holosporales bacterium]